MRRRTATAPSRSSTTAPAATRRSTCCAGRTANTAGGRTDRRAPRAAGPAPRPRADQDGPDAAPAAAHARGLAAFLQRGARRAEHRAAGDRERRRRDDQPARQEQLEMRMKKPRPFAKKGKIVTCTAGHKVCAVAMPLMSGGMIKPRSFENWRPRQTRPEPGDPIRPCYLRRALHRREPPAALRGRMAPRLTRRNPRRHSPRR